MSITEKLLSMKEQINTAKTNKAKEEGKLEELDKRLVDEFEVTGIDEAKKLLAKMEKEMETKQTQLDKGLQKLEDDYEWG
jgi:hypothetical protein